MAMVMAMAMVMVTVMVTPCPRPTSRSVITADNAYGFGYGTVDTVGNYYGGIENTTAAQIFNCAEGPELYEIPAEVADQATHLYIIAWADSSVTQGVLARFQRADGMGGFGDNVLTGDPGWEVCATGLNYNPGSGGPPLDVVNEQIALCNQAHSTPRPPAWVGSMRSGPNTARSRSVRTTRPPTMAAPRRATSSRSSARWSCPQTPTGCGRTGIRTKSSGRRPARFCGPAGSNPDHQFLIFRLAAELIPEPQ